MRILVLQHLLPVPLDSGAKIRSYSTIKALASRHELMMVSYVRNEDELKHLAKLRQLCDRIELVPMRRGPMRKATDALSNVMLGRSFIVSRDYRVEMRQAFRKALTEFRPDAVHVDHLQMAQFLDRDVRCATVLDEHNVESTIIRRIAETSRSPLTRLYAGLEWPKLQRFELRACRESDLVLTVSEEDKAELMRQDPSLNNIETLPIGIDTDYFGPVSRQAGSKDILFLGTMYWPPNVECVHYFCREILPIVRKSIPDCTFTIAGQRPVKSVAALGSNPGIRVTGYVDDVRQVGSECGVFVVPLQAGSGVRVKILNAMSMGLPVVSTSVGAEGIDATPEKHLLTADTPQDFARAIVRTLEDPELAGRLGANARQLVCEKYSWDVVGKQALDLYEKHIEPMVKAGDRT
jgi:sugar transferase (PEP-CTERM/EpsH1 system associated)